MNYLQMLRTPAEITAFVRTEAITGRPTITRVYTPARGWIDDTHGHRCTIRRVASLRRAGVTNVSIRCGRRVVAWPIGNLLY